MACLADWRIATLSPLFTARSGPPPRNCSRFAAWGQGPALRCVTSQDAGRPSWRSKRSPATATDLCRLVSVFHVGKWTVESADYRINEWLKARIAEAKERESKSGESQQPLQRRPLHRAAVSCFPIFDSHSHAAQYG